MEIRVWSLVKQVATQGLDAFVAGQECAFRSNFTELLYKDAIEVREMVGNKADSFFAGWDAACDWNTLQIQNLTPSAINLSEQVSKFVYTRDVEHISSTSIVEALKANWKAVLEALQQTLSYTITCVYESPMNPGVMKKETLINIPTFDSLKKKDALEALEHAVYQTIQAIVEDNRGGGVPAFKLNPLVLA